MEKIKKKLIQMKRHFRHNKYINGTKGVVSIFLAVLITPLLSLSLLVVETARYQHALQSMEEVADLAANSTLATMDSYLNERFGLLSIDQEKSVSTQFDKYMKADASAIGNHATYKSGKITGKYALSDLDILKQQIAELGELSVPIEAAYEGFDIEGFLEKLTDITDFMKGFSEKLDNVKKGAEALQEAIDLIDAAKNINKDCSTYNTKLQEYKDAYSELEKSIYTTDATDEDYVAVLTKVISELPSDAAEGAEYDMQTVKDAYKKVDENVDTYKKKAGELKLAIEKLQKDIDKLAKAPDILDKMDSLNTGDEFGKGVQDILSLAREPLTKLVKAMANTSKEDMQPAINALETQVVALGKIDNTTIKSDWTDATVKQKYGPVAADTLTALGALKSAVSNFVKAIDSAKVDTGVDKDSMGEFINICTSIFKVQGMYDEALSANVSDKVMYSKVAESPSTQLAKIFVDALAAYTGACEDFMDNIGNGVIGLLAAAKATVSLVVAAVTFVGTLVATLGETLDALVDFAADMASSGGGMAACRNFYDRMLMYGYGTYNMPNRTTVDDSGIYGYDFGDVYKLGSKTSGYVRKGSTESLSALASINKDGGTDSMFFGAEGEYLLAGTKSEKYNQAITFVDLFVLRVLMDLPAAFADKEFKEISKCAGEFFWVVDILAGVAEGYIDTIILVNKGSEPLIKTKVYFTSSGIKRLTKDLYGILGFDTNLKDKIKEYAKKGGSTSGSKSDAGGTSGGTGDAGGTGGGAGDAGGTGGGAGGAGGTGDKDKKDSGNGYFSVSYTEHLMLMILTRVKDETYIERIRNIIQMEAATKYKEYTFKLDKAYTYFKADITYKINPMLPVDNISDNTKLLTFKTSQYVGY